MSRRYTRTDTVFTSLSRALKSSSTSLGGRTQTRVTQEIAHGDTGELRRVHSAATISSGIYAGLGSGARTEGDRRIDAQARVQMDKASDIAANALAVHNSQPSAFAPLAYLAGSLAGFSAARLGGEGVARSLRLDTHRRIRAEIEDASRVVETGASQTQDDIQATLDALRPHEMTNHVPMSPTNLPRPVSRLLDFGQRCLGALSRRS